MLPEEPKEQDLESIKAELEEASKRVMERQLQDLNEVNFQPNNQVSGNSFPLKYGFSD